MSDLPIKYPKSTLYDLASLFAPADIPPDSSVELIITIKENNLNVREFGSYLSLADRIYGRVSRVGLRSYSLTPYTQLEISEVRRGSIELIITEALLYYKDATLLLILWLFLKYFPAGIKMLSESTKNFADSYKSIEEGRLIRENRKQLKEKMKHDELLQELDDKQINQMITMLADLETAERYNLPAATRFAFKSVESVRIVLKKRNE